MIYTNNCISKERVYASLSELRLPHSGRFPASKNSIHYRPQRERGRAADGGELIAAYQCHERHEYGRANYVEQSSPAAGDGERTLQFGLGAPQFPG